MSPHPPEDRRAKRDHTARHTCVERESCSADRPERSTRRGRFGAASFGAAIDADATSGSPAGSRLVASPMKSRTVVMRSTAGAPLMVTANGALWCASCARSGTTARSRSRPTRLTTSRSVMLTRTIGRPGWDGGPVRNVPSPSRIPTSQWKSVASMRRVLSVQECRVNHGACRCNLRGD